MKIKLQEPEFNILIDAANTNDGAVVFEAGEEYNGLFINDIRFKAALETLERHGLATIERDQHEVFVQIDQKGCWKVDFEGCYDIDGNWVKRA